MEKFREFKLENLEMIFGGKLIPTSRGNDMYDTERERIIYFPS